MCNNKYITKQRSKRVMQIEINIKEIPEIKDAEIETVDYWAVKWELPRFYHSICRHSSEIKQEIFLTKEKADEYANILRKAFKIVGSEYYADEVKVSKKGE
jgi:hypothetical protein